MSRLTWGALGERYFETGVDRGVLYVGEDPGVAWNGLISVSESPTGGEAKPAYVDGYKFRNLASSEEFEATIDAFTAPKEFGPCDGTSAIQNGLFITQQPRKRFNFTYRTMVGNGAQGPDADYKIHLVYNALASPSERSNNTLSESAEAASRSWSITTRSPFHVGHKPTAHFIIDSRYTPGTLLTYIEGLLYGTEANAPRMPSVEELIDAFNSPGPIVARNLATNPSVETNTTTIGAGFGANGFVRDNTKSKTGAYSLRATATGTAQNCLLWTIPTLPGNTYSFGVWAWVPTGVINVKASAYFVLDGAPVATKDDWVWITHSFTASAVTTQCGVATTGGSMVIGQQFWADSIIVVEGIVVPDAYFDGDTLDTDTEVYEWVGTPHASQSIKRSLV